MADLQAKHGGNSWPDNRKDIESIHRQKTDKITAKFSVKRAKNFRDNSPSDTPKASR
jgi:hypothetical protein